MENNNNKINGSENNEPKEEKSWLERNLWTIAVFAAIFLVHMCNEMSRH